MSGFISALIRQRKEAKKAEPDTNGRLKEILGVLKNQNYDNGITPEVIVNILEELGPTFVKIGQIASQQAEYIPAEYCDALASLRSNVAPMDFDTVRGQIEKYLGKPMDQLYASFDEKPLGSASIAQVHRAVLKDGTVVAVKVRRPGIVDTVARDFALVEKVLEKFLKEEKDTMGVRDMITELENISKIELDFTNEAENLDRFREYNEDRENIESPKCYRELTCEAVLTEGFVTGTEVSDTAYLATLDDEKREKIAALVADNFASQILTDGFYHADPHSGNVLIKEDEQSIEWIDFGMMGILTSKQRQILVDIVTNVIMHDAYGLKLTTLKVARPRGEVDHGALLEMCEGICDQYTGGGFEDFDLGDLLSSVLGTIQDGNYKVDPFLTNLARGITAMEGTVKTLSPKVNILNFFTDKLDTGLGFSFDREHLQELNPKIVAKLLKFLQGVTDSSSKKAETLDMLEKGQIRMRSDLSIEKKTQDYISSLTGYVIRAMIIVAIIIGSSVLCTASVISEDTKAVTIIFRAVGAVGFIVSLIFAYRLCRDMKKGRQ